MTCRAAVLKKTIIILIFNFETNKSNCLRCKVNEKRTNKGIKNLFLYVTIIAHIFGKRKQRRKMSLGEIIVKGFIIGLLVASPMGPINMLCIQRTLNRVGSTALPPE